MAAAAPRKPTSTDDVPLNVKFATAGLGGIMGWMCVHPFNTAAVRMNLASTQPNYQPTGFVAFFLKTGKERGYASFYDGIGAGVIRQIFYATSRFGLFETFRDAIAARREIGVAERLAAGLASGACAAVISCPAEVSLVRLSNDATLPEAERRNYKSPLDAAARIAREEGVGAFWRGCSPFVQRAMLVGVTQVGTLDQAKAFYDASFGIPKGTYGNVFAASMTSGLLYSLITMPFESAKNRMAFQKPDANGVLPFRSTAQTILSVANAQGPLALWNGFPPYYLRCGGHTVTMFIFVEMRRSAYQSSK
ncbi:thiosulfate transmembrane transporter [Aureococcus anophagefferens]|nr:thiosulfate transmembrane transporter [Aureococcus anophagefferens]